MSRRLAIAALVAALLLPCLAGCGSTPTTGKGSYTTSGSGPASTGRPADSGKEKTATHHHDPG
jgi:hypothetical protein